MKEIKEFIYVVFMIPCKKESSKQRVEENLYRAMKHIELSQEEKDILDSQGIFIKQLVLPTFDEEVKIIKIFPNELSEHMKRKMENNVMLIQDYIKKLNYE